MAVYCWGNTVHGELGLGGIEDEQVWIVRTKQTVAQQKLISLYLPQILLPREMDWCHSSSVQQAACGTTHTLLLTKDGKLFSCGNNDHGQLGHDTDCLPNKRPRTCRFSM